MAIEAPIVEVSTPIVAAAMWRDLYIEYWRRPGRAAEMRLVHEVQRGFIRRTSRKFAVLMVVTAVDALDAETRKLIDQAARELRPHFKAAAMALLAGGFSGAIVRGALAGANLLSRSEYPNRVVDTVPAACAFIAPHVGGAGIAAATASEVEDVARKVEATPAR